MNHCGEKFHGEVAKFRFLNELIKVLSPKVGILGLTTCPSSAPALLLLLPISAHGRPAGGLSPQLSWAHGGGGRGPACGARSSLIADLGRRHLPSQPSVGVAWWMGKGLYLGDQCPGRDGTGHQVWLEVHSTSSLDLCTLCPVPSWVTAPHVRCVSSSGTQSILAPAAPSVLTLLVQGSACPDHSGFRHSRKPRGSPSHCSSA